MTTSLFLDSVRAFTSRAIEPVAADIDQADRVPAGLLSAMRDIDLLAVDGDGPELPELLEVIEFIARTSASVAMLIAMPAAAVELLAPSGRQEPAGTQRTTGLRGVPAGFAEAADAGQRRIALLGAAAVAVGVSGAAHERAAAYAATRTAFGRTLTEFPVLERKLAEMAARIVASRMLLARAVVSDDVDTAGITARSATRTAVAVTYSAIQLHGGYGYMAEYGVEKLARDAISLRALVSQINCN